MADTTEYNGWKNHATWLVSLWIGNEQELYTFWQRQAASIKRQSQKGSYKQIKDGIWTKEECARFKLADMLKEKITNGVPETMNGFYVDLINSALSDVSWDDIAQHLLDEID